MTAYKDSFGGQPSVSAAVNSASSEMGTLNPTPFEYSFVFGKPFTVFATGEVSIHFGPTSMPSYEADVQLTSGVLGVYDAAGRLGDAQFMPVPEPASSAALLGLVLLILILSFRVVKSNS